MWAALAAKGLGMSPPIGFDDSYAIAVTRGAAERFGLRALSDLARHPVSASGSRTNSWGAPTAFPAWRRATGSRGNVTGIQHEPAYAALASGKIDGTDIYTTDAQIERLGLRVLEDDRRFFPRYDAVWLYRLDLARREPRALEAIRKLTGRIDQARMIRANGRVVLGGLDSNASADSLLAEIGALTVSAPPDPAAGAGPRPCSATPHST